jgi:hypothetical protein
MDILDRANFSKYRGDLEYRCSCQSIDPVVIIDFHLFVCRFDSAPAESGLLDIAYNKIPRAPLTYHKSLLE